MSKGSNTTTSSNTPTALPAYQNAISQLQNVAATPYTPYGGELIAPVNQQQYAGIGGINQFATAAQPYLQTAAGYAQSAAQPLTQAQIQQYESPYTQDVVNATEAQFNNQNAQQQQQILGNAAAQGALGGDRTAVAQAVLAGQQQAQEAPVIAGLENQGYLTGLQTAQQQQQNLAQGAYNLGNVANSIQNAGLMGANAQVGAGTLEQQTQQAADQAAYQQFMQQQFMPESMLSWELPLLTGVGSQEGGTSTTTGPAPNPLGQYLGLGIAGLGAAGQAGGSAGIAGLLPLLGLSDRRAKENIRKIGKLNNGRDVYRFNYKGDPTTHIGLMAQDVEKDNPDAVHEVGGLKHVDYDEATKDAVRRFLGGRIQGLQSGGVPSGLGFSPGGNPWLTDAPMPLGPGAPPPPKLPGQVVQTPAQMAQNATGLANAMKQAFPTTQNNGDDVTTVGINSATGQFQSGPGINTGFMEYDNGVPTGILGVGPTDAGLTYGPGYRDGGLTLPRHNRIDLKRSMPVRAGLGMASFMPRRGFDDGGAADLSPNDYIAQNFPATLPGPRGVPFDASDPDAGIFSPVAPGRDPKYSLANLTDTGLMPTDLPPEITAGMSAPPQQTGLGAATAYMPEDVGSREGPLPAPPDSVNAPPEQTKGQSSGLSPDFWTALTAAGLGMMASRSPFLGVAVGEGGLQGIQTYSSLKQQRVTQDEINAKVDLLNTQAKAAREQLSATEALRAGDAGPAAGAATPKAALAGVLPGENPIATVQQTVRAAANVAAVQQTPAGPVGVDGRGRPVLNPNDLLAKAQRYIASGVPAYQSAGEKLMQLYQTMLDKGVTTDAQGNVIALPGAQETAARAAGLVEQAKAPYQIAQAAVREGARPTTVSPNQVVTTGAEVSPTLSAIQNWALTHLPGAAPPGSTTGAAPPIAGGSPAGGGTAAPAAGTVQPPLGQSPFAPKLIRNPDGSVTSSVTPAIEQMQKDAANRFEKAADAYTNAQDIKMRLGIMQQDADQLNKAGWSTTGEGNAARVGLAKTINSISTALGGQPIFDPTTVGSWESLNKQTTQMGFELARTLGSREAMMIVQQATGSVPNAANTPLGFRLVSSAIQQQVQRQADYYQFALDQLRRNGGDTIGAEVAFNKAHPPQEYAARAIANGIVDPRDKATLLANGNNPAAISKFKTLYPGIDPNVLLTEPQ